MPGPEQLNLTVTNGQQAAELILPIIETLNHELLMPADVLRLHLNELHARNPGKALYLLVDAQSPLTAQSPENDSNDPYSFFANRITVVPDEKAVLLDAEPVVLSPIEYRLTALLGREPGKVLSHRIIYEAAWETPYKNNARSLQVHMGTARKKLAPDAFINHRGFGYSAAE